ncbi:hypothetical protein K9F62_10090 [Desulfovibrio sp. JY]|nr:hypothetical protein K9F62_10090 [Desulfovibrio sp. JY]
MSKRKRMTGKAEEMEQIAQVLRQNGLPEMAVRAALVCLCGVQVSMVDNGSAYMATNLLTQFLGE